MGANRTDLLTGGVNTVLVGHNLQTRAKWGQEGVKKFISLERSARTEGLTKGHEFLPSPAP
jgi:hypothetical protein